MKTLWTQKQKPKTRPGIYVTHDDFPRLVAQTLVGLLSPLVEAPAREPRDRRPDSIKDPKKRVYKIRPRLKGHTHRGCCGDRCYGVKAHSKKRKK